MICSGKRDLIPFFLMKSQLGWLTIMTFYNILENELWKRSGIVCKDNV